MLYKSQMLYVI